MCVSNLKPEEKSKFDGIFESLAPVNGLLSGEKVKPVLINSKLPLDVLGKVCILFFNFRQFLTKKIWLFFERQIPNIYTTHVDKDNWSCLFVNQGEYLIVVTVH